MGVRKIVASTAGLAAITILAVVGVVQIMQIRVAHAASLQPSILCAPNTCQGYDNNSVQDVQLKHPSWGRYYVEDNRNSKNMNRINLEIAKINIHHMQSITVGVYATEVSSTGIDLRITRDETRALCTVDSAVKSKSDLVVVTVGTGTTARTATEISGSDLCDKFGPHGPGVVVTLVPSDFTDNTGLNLKETKVSFGYNDVYYDTTDPTYKTLGSVGLKMKLDDCTGSCRRYIGLIRADTGPEDTENLNAARNYALEGDDSSNYTSDSIFSSDSIRLGGTQLYSREYFEFGLECSFDTPQTKYVDIYDLNDNDFVSSHSDLIGAVLQQYVIDSTTGVGRWQIVPKSEITKRNGTIVDLSNSERGLNSKNRRLYGLTGDDWVFIPQNGNRRVSHIGFTMQPKTRYRLMILPNGFDNFFGIGAPGDQIYGLLGCDTPPPILTPSMECGLNDTNFSSISLNTLRTLKPALKLYNVPVPPTTIDYRVYKLGDNPPFSSISATVEPPGVTASFDYKPLSMGTYVMEWKATAGSLSKQCSQTVTIGYQPYFTVIGGDILGGFDATTSIIASWNSDDVTDNYRGAGTTLAAIAGTKGINSFVTSSGTNSPSLLAFANTPASASGKRYGGDYSSTRLMPDYYGDAAASPLKSCPSTSIDLSSFTLPLGSGVYDCSGDITISGELAAGINVTIITDGNVFIAGDITYAPYNLTNIPRLNVITENGNIVVSSTVATMHGVFIAGAGGKFYSCGSSPANGYGYATNNPVCLSASTLTVYGSVVADELILGRTKGAWTDPTPEPAEKFIYSPETWLSKPASTGNTSRPLDSYISLPPVL